MDKINEKRTHAYSAKRAESKKYAKSGDGNEQNRESEKSKILNHNNGVLN